MHLKYGNISIDILKPLDENDCVTKTYITRDKDSTYCNEVLLYATQDGQQLHITIRLDKEDWPSNWLPSEEK